MTHSEVKKKRGESRKGRGVQGIFGERKAHIHPPGPGFLGKLGRRTLNLPTRPHRNFRFVKLDDVQLSLNRRSGLSLGIIHNDKGEELPK
ncbi:hypothetical protein VNO77_44175 [Canavalia gladiata]|uniref:Uncharacterized protein n=1 Tax=Canavalia gladiata TaxID=3824 RepID=A0AAN9JZ66_CANGL